MGCAIAIACMLAHAAAADVSKEDAARANALFDAGRAAIDAGRVDEACARFEQSLALDPQVGTRMNLADCREKQGRLIEAYQLYEYGAAEAEQENKPGRLEFARKQLERLAGSLVRIRLKVTEVPGLQLRLVAVTGTRELPPPVWSRTVITDPGPFSIEASATDHKPVKIVSEGAPGSVVEIEIPKLESTVVIVPPPPPPPPRRSVRIPLIVGGAGVVVLGTGVALAVIPEDQTTLATATCIVGAVGIGLGVYLYVRARRTVVVAPTATATSAGVSLLGRF